MTSISNFVSAVCEVLSVNCNSLTTDNANSNVWSVSTLDLGDAWLTADPNDEKSKALRDAIAALQAALKNGQQPDYAGFFIKLTNGDFPIGMWSMDLVTAMEQVISQDPKAGGDDKDNIGAWNSTISQYGSLIQSTKEQETSTGDSENKACQSALQNASSAGQPATNAGDSMMGLLSNGSSVQAQISA